jgi:glycosyltransferase involved in cell wall biosynthesis
MIAIVNNHWMHYKDLLFRSLSEKKVDFVAVFSALGSSQRAAPALNEGYNYRVLYPGDYEKRSHAKTGYRAWRTLQQLKPSTVIIEGWRDLSSWTAWLWAILHKVPIIFWSESNDFDKPRNPMAEWPKRLFASRVSYGHVYGRSNRDYLTNLGIPKDKVLLDRVVVNTEMFLSRQSSFDSAALRFLYVGRLAPEKNLEYLLNEFSSFVKQARLAHTLTIVGSGPLAPKLEAQVKTLGLEKSACLTRSMPYERLGDTYAASHIFVLPSLSEPCRPTRNNIEPLRLRCRPCNGKNRLALRPGGLGQPRRGPQPRSRDANRDHRSYGPASTPPRRQVLPGERS